MYEKKNQKAFTGYIPVVTLIFADPHHERYTKDTVNKIILISKICISIGKKDIKQILDLLS